MDFEARTKKMVHDLVDPLIIQGEEGMSSIYRFNAFMKKGEERLRTLEAIMLKGPKNGTIFEDIEQRIITSEVNLKIEIER